MRVSEADGAALRAIARRFEEFARTEAHGTSPLYERLALAVAAEPDLAASLLLVPSEQRAQTLYFAAIHDLVLEHGLAFPTDAGELRAFCRGWAGVLADRLASRRTQTNEVARCAYFLPAFGLIWAETREPIALLEVGASAGLLLAFDRYRYLYGVTEIGDPASPVVIAPEIRGVPPPLPPLMPPVVSRLGLDVEPLDLSDPAAVRWLEACVWFDHPDRAEALDRAVDLVRRDPPRLMRGDGVRDLEAAAASLPTGGSLVVMHSSMLPYLPEKDRRRFREAIGRLSRQCPLWWVLNEGTRGFLAELFGADLLPQRAERFGALVIVRVKGGREAPRLLALTGAHGRWIEWVE